MPVSFFSNDYHFKNLGSLKNKLDNDSLKRMDAALWSRADLMLTDAFMHIIKDLKQGRLQPDSLTLNRDSLLVDNFFAQGYSNENLVDLVLQVSDKTAMNYLHNLTKVPVDFPLAPAL